MTKENVKYVCRIVLPLFIICVCVVAVLAAINALTAPVIADNNERALNESLAAFYGDDIKAEPVNGSFDSSVKTVYRVKKNDADVGYCFDVTGSGAYKGRIEVLVALDGEGKIIGISNVKNGETPSIGGKVLAEGGVKDNYIGASFDTLPAFSEVSLSGATRTSTALQNAVKNAFDAYKSLTGGVSLD